MHWASVRPQPRELALVGRRARTAGALLAVLWELALIFIWVHQTHVDSPWGKSGIPDAVVAMQYFPMAGEPQHAPRPARKPAAKRPKPTPVPPINTITLPAPLPSPPIPPAKAEPPPEPPPMSDAAAAEFRRQWAQLQGDLKQQALEDARHHGLKVEPADAARQRDSEMAKLRDRDKPLQTVQQERGQRSEHANRQDSDGDILAGELCVTGSGRDGDVQVALPCIGDNYTIDFGWYARVHAPKRGDPDYRPIDPNGHVFVRQYPFAPATLAAFDDAFEQLGKIQVTIRMVYLPDLRFPFQLVSRDRRASAVGAEAFASEAELAQYLQTWADNVRRWNAPRPGDSAAPAAAPGR